MELFGLGMFERNSACLPLIKGLFDTSISVLQPNSPPNTFILHIVGGRWFRPKSNQLETNSHHLSRFFFFLRHWAEQFISRVNICIDNYSDATMSFMLASQLPSIKKTATKPKCSPDDNMLWWWVMLAVIVLSWDTSTPKYISIGMYGIDVCQTYQLSKQNFQM